MIELTDFLNDRCKVSESLSVNIAVSKLFPSKPNLKGQINKQVSWAFVSNSPCPLCKERHPLYQYDSFQSLPPSGRYIEVKKFKLCTKFLRSNHTFQNFSSGHCVRCNKKYHTLLHFDGSPSDAQKQSNPSSHVNPRHLSTTSLALNQRNSPEQKVEVISDQSTSSTSVTLTSCLNGFNDQGMLATARIVVFDSQGQPREFRAFLDNDSQFHYISIELCKYIFTSLPKFFYYN